jgi:polysaccharide biosynthesis protein PslG
LRRFVIASVLLLSLALSTQARAAAPREFYGVIPATDPDATEIARMGAGRVGTMRINLVWASVQSNSPSQFDWGHYDNLIGAAAQNGIRVLPTIYGTPSWAAARQNHPPSKAHLGDFGAFVRAAAERYGANGTFWAQHPEIAKLPVIDWQLWNEVNSPSFWYRKPSAKQYVGLLRVMRAGIKAGDPGGRVILAGLFPTPVVRKGVSLDRYLGAIYKRKAKPLFDAVAIHPYSTTPRDALRRLRDLRRLMARFKDKRTPVWVTELGWATGGNPTPLTVSPQRQANYLRRAFNLLAANRGRLRIHGVVWYSWRDLPGGIWFNHTGLFSQDLQPKPSWNAFVSLTGGSPNAPVSNSALRLPQP